MTTATTAPAPQQSEADRADWLAWRKKHLGASEAPALFLDNHYFTIGDLYLYKTGQAEPPPPSEPMLAGQMFEPAVIDYALEKITEHTGEKPKGRRNVRRVIDEDHKVHAATLDYQIGEGRGAVPLDAKTTGLFGPIPEADMWGEDLTDEIPYEHIIQLHQQMLCTGGDHAWLAAWIGFRGMHLYRVERDQNLIEAVHDEGLRFWRTYIEPYLKDGTKIWPEAKYSLESLKRVRKNTDLVEVAPSSLLREFAELREVRLEAEKAEKAAQEAIRALNPEATVFEGVDEDGAPDGWTAKIAQVTSRRVSVSKIRELYPEAAEFCTEASVSERFSVKAPKTVKVVK